MTEIHGSYDDLFVAVPTALAASIDQVGGGAAVAVFVDGEPVVDVWGGVADPGAGTEAGVGARAEADTGAETGAGTGIGPVTAWGQDTITNVWSVTKTMTALSVLVLADHRELDLDAPVARYWPEFAAAGKEGVLIRHVLSHTAGLPLWDGPINAETCYDWSGVTSGLAAQTPDWEPGTAAGYHSLTQGFLLGEVVRRITGRSVGEFFADEVGGPLGADFHIGLPAEHDRRVAPTLPPTGQSQDFTASAAGGKSGDPASGGIRVSDGNSVAWRRAQIPAASGFGNARSVALVQSVMACGGAVGGTRLLTRATCDRAMEVQFRGMDRMFERPMSYSMGYGAFGRSFGWGGWGGSLVLFDPDSRLTVAYVTNQMLDPAVEADTRGMEMVMASYDGVTGLAA